MQRRGTMETWRCRRPAGRQLQKCWCSAAWTTVTLKRQLGLCAQLCSGHNFKKPRGKSEQLHFRVQVQAVLPVCNTPKSMQEFVAVVLRVTDAICGVNG
mmetsp:Transcript_475/g.945  ORF Transcript_475/g.945 Transcript_475/m.945 type:complete len:99 (-) Transcript_475:146-442(-)